MSYNVPGHEWRDVCRVYFCIKIINNIIKNDKIGKKFNGESEDNF